MAKDPICGMEVDETKALYTVELGDEVYFFCSEACKNKFLAQLKKKRNIFQKFFDWLAAENKKNYGDKPPKCCH